MVFQVRVVPPAVMVPKDSKVPMDHEESLESRGQRVLRVQMDPLDLKDLVVILEMQEQRVHVVDQVTREWQDKVACL